MLGRTYETQNCSAARALELVGERWSLLIVRDALFRGYTKYTEFQRELGIAPNVLAARLERFVEAGLMTTRPAADGHRHHEYVLTEKGRSLQPVVMALTAWGDRWAAPDGPPVVYRHQECGGEVEQSMRCRSCAADLEPADVLAAPGPGLG